MSELSRYFNEKNNPWNKPSDKYLKKMFDLEKYLPEYSSEKEGILLDSKDEFSLAKVLQIANSQLWIHEETRISDKYFNEYLWEYKEKISWAKVDTREDNWAWCAAFTSWCLRQAGYKWEITIRAKNFIKKEWKWHVAFKEWNNMVWWNQENQVSSIPIPFDKIVWYAVPKVSWLEVFKRPKSLEEIPDWAILAFDRGWNDTQYT